MSIDIYIYIYVYIYIYIYIYIHIYIYNKAESSEHLVVLFRVTSVGHFYSCATLSASSIC